MEKRIYYLNTCNLNNDLLLDYQKQYLLKPESLLDLKVEDSEFITEKITGFLKDYKTKNNINGFVVGLSGGIDSSLTLDLSVEAVGKENVIGLILPSAKTSDESINFGKQLAAKYDVAFAIIDRRLFEMSILTDNLIEEDIERQFKKHGKWTHSSFDNLPMRIGNDHARQRMKILRRQAAKYGVLVNGTTNDTEQQLAYFTIAGDGRGGIDLEPLIMLPKTSEYKYAAFRNIDQKIINRIPTAELLDNHTDESELSKLLGCEVTYESIDLILTGIKLKISVEDIEKSNKNSLVTIKSILSVQQYLNRIQYKKVPEPYADLSHDF